MPRSAASSSVRNHLLAVRRSLSALDRALARLAASLNGVGPSRVGRSRPVRKLSPQARAALKLQGRYMGYMRQLRPRQKVEVRAVKEKKGIEAGIKKAQALAGKAA